MNRLSKYRTELYGFSILWIMIFHGNAICDVVYFHRFPVLKVVDRLIGWGNMGVEVVHPSSGDRRLLFLHSEL